MLFALGKQLAKLTSDKVLPSRIGGEEFAIIVDGLSAQEVDELAQSILQNARAILINHDNPLSISIGVGLRHKDEPQNQFIKKVDDALYKAKITAAGEWNGPCELSLLRAAAVAAIFGRRALGIAFKHPAEIVAVDKPAVVGDLFDLKVVAAE